MLLTFAASSVLVAVLLGGDPRRLGQVDLQRLPWILASFIIRDVSEELWKSETPALWASLLLAFVCYALLFYGLAPNLRFPGMRAVWVGSLLNFVVIVLNQGRMPVSIESLTPAEQAQELSRLSASINHQLLASNAKMRPLSDLFKWSFLQKRPLMFSAGDVLICLGVAWLILRVSLRGFPVSGNDGRIGSDQ